MIRHVPVLPQQVTSSLNLKSGDKIIDCTLGDAGHSELMLNLIGTKGRLLGIDADPESLMRAKQNLYNYESQTVFARGNFTELEKIAEANGFQKVNAILIDLGWSTPQFKERGRGFTFLNDEPLDMRFDPNSKTDTAAEILNSYGIEDLVKIFKQYGEEKFAREIAFAISDARNIAPLQTTGQLSEIILKVYRRILNTEKEIPWIGGIHPATKIFQALRIEVNQELEVLKQVLPQAINLLAPGGRLAVITFHSLEDRIVKQYFQKEINRTIKLVNKKPLIATDEEIKENPSSRSAKLRVVEKII